MKYAGTPVVNGLWRIELNLDSCRLVKQEQADVFQRNVMVIVVYLADVKNIFIPIKPIQQQAYPQFRETLFQQ